MENQSEMFDTSAHWTLEVLTQAHEALQVINQMYSPPFYFKEEVKRILEEDLGINGFYLVFSNQYDQILDGQEARSLLKQAEEPMISSVYTVGTVDHRVSVFLLRLKIKDGKLADMENATSEILLTQAYIESQ